MRKIESVLVANRGEIALRIMRSLRELGIRTVAVYSDADRLAPFVCFADEAYRIGGPRATESYLNQESIIAVAHEARVQAIHPGYGFLSENAEFAELTERENLIFIGPGPQSIRMMGNKIQAKKLMVESGVPLVPGSLRDIQNPDDVRIAAEEMGYPVIIKASAGGGGKGMRVIYREDQIEDEMARAAGEAGAAFGDMALFVEKYIERPRHIEIQIFGDRHGNYIHLFERDCSIQRRHQKLIEEAPSAVLDADLRARMGEDAIRAAMACRYWGAGTVEFMLDADLNYYFLEMNTRLQVEHPVTEMITGLDLVKLQILVAQDEPLPFRQEDIKIHGHAIEVRVNAEDPDNDFLPDTGTLAHCELPSGPGVRVDDGYRAGLEVSVHYDPLMAKLIVWGSDRLEAIERMKRALGEYYLSGIKTTLEFARYVMNHPAFISAEHTTNFVSEYFQPGQRESTDDEKEVAILLAAWLKNKSDSGAILGPDSKPTGRNWKKRYKL